MVPCGLLGGGTVTAPVKKGTLRTYANVAPDAASRLVALRARRDAMVFGEG